MYVRLVVSFVKTARQAIKQNSALNAQTFFTVNRLSVSALRKQSVCGQWKKEGYLTHGVDALTEASDEGRRRLRKASGSCQPSCDPGISE